MLSTHGIVHIISALALLIVLSGGLSWAEEKGNAASDSDLVLTSPTRSPHETLPGVAPVKYVRETIPQAEVPVAKGTYYDALVPDTLDLAERARLVINTYIQCACPEADYELYTSPRFHLDPPRLRLQSGGGLCWPKYMEALPLMRIMSGSTQGLELDKAWAENILHQLGPNGLWYLSITGRPWDNQQVDDGMGTVDDQIYSDKDEQYCYIALNGRILGTLTLYYQITGDEIWNQAAEDMVDGFRRVVSRDGDKAYFPYECYYPDGAPPQGNGQQNMGWNGVGLGQYARVTNYKPAVDLDKAMINWYRATFFDDGMKLDANLIHVWCMWLQAMTEYALATHDMEWAKFAQKYYESIKAFSTPDSKCIPSIGWFPTTPFLDCACAVSDMTHLAVELTQLGVGDYWDDVDRYARNHLTERQILRPDQVSEFVQELRDGRAVVNPSWSPSGEQSVPVTYNELADELPNRLVGWFSGVLSQNDLFAFYSLDACCIGNGPRALYYVWENIVTYDKGTLSVNLLLNRASKWADVESCIPYTGRVDVKVKKRCDLRIRMNDWIDQSKVECTVNGKATAFTWDGRYAQVGSVTPDQVVTVTFPISERTEEIQIGDMTFTVVFRGNDVVGMSPRGPNVPLYERSYYRDGRVKYVKVRRFCPDQEPRH